MGILIPWAIASGIVTVRDLRQKGTAPVPAEFVAAGALFGALAVFGSTGPNAEQVATVAAWGFMLALLLQAASGRKKTLGQSLGVAGPRTAGRAATQQTQPGGGM